MTSFAAIAFPSWMDADRMRTAMIVATGAFGALACCAMVLVRKAVTKIFFVGVLAAVGLGAWFYRADLERCQKTCTCSLAGHKIEVPKCQPAPAAAPAAVPARP